MPSYTPILIGTNYIGASGEVTVSEANGDGSLNQLLSTVGNEKFIIDSFEIWSDSTDQLQQPIQLTQLKADGNHKVKNVVPQKCVYQFGNVLKDLKTGNFPLDENTRISYNVLANTNTKMTLNINKDIRKDNSLVKLLAQAGGKSIQPEVLKDLGLREPEELNWNENKKKTKAEDNLNAEGDDMQPQGKSNDTATKLIFAGLVITAGAFVLYALSRGAAKYFIKK